MHYLDHAATRYPKPHTVIESVCQTAASPVGNPGRSGHGLALDAGLIVYETRAALADYLQIDPMRVAFAANGTDALNMLIHGLPRGFVVGTTEIEHNSVVRPLRDRAERHEIEMRIVPVDAVGRIMLDSPMLHGLDALVVSAASNVLAARNDPAMLRHAVGQDCWLCIDGAQLVGEVAPATYIPWVDAVAAPGHKALGGPPGTGFLYANEKLKLHPYRQGGTGSRSEMDKQPDDWPDGFEAGSTNVWGLAGLHAAVEHVQQEDWTIVHRLWHQMVDLLKQHPSFTIHSATEGPCAPILTFSVRGQDANEVGWKLWEHHHVAVRAGLHCAPGAHRHVGTMPDGAIRASLGPTNTLEDIDALYIALQEVL